MTSETIVLKLGGEVVTSTFVSAICDDIAALQKKGTHVVVVHGGGPQVTELQKQLGQTPIQIAGRRVTDDNALNVLKMVVAGRLNLDLCCAILRAGANPIGLHGASGHVIVAKKRPPRIYAGAGSEPIDLGLVGDVASINTEFISSLCAGGMIPVLACVGASNDGQAYNINADTVANRVAGAIKANSLMLISDVTGVLRDVNDPNSKISTLTSAEGKAMIQSGAISKGMIVKIEEAFSAIQDGVKRVHILGRLCPKDLLRETENPGSVGTVVMA